MAAAEAAVDEMENEKVGSSGTPCSCLCIVSCMDRRMLYQAV